MDFKFKKVKFIHKEVIFSWLDAPHIKEFWDNSQEHRDDIENFMGGRSTPSPYFNGIFTYWIGFCEDEPYCLIMTSEENEDTHPPDYFKPYLSKTGKTIGLDFCIGNDKYLNKGLATPTLVAFTKYFKQEIEPTTDTYLIDPHSNNRRAINVYEKAGFHVVCEYTKKVGYFSEMKGVLMLKKEVR